MYYPSSLIQLGTSGDTWRGGQISTPNWSSDQSVTIKSECLVFPNRAIGIITLDCVSGFGFPIDVDGRLRLLSLGIVCPGRAAEPGLTVREITERLILTVSASAER